MIGGPGGLLLPTTIGGSSGILEKGGATWVSYEGAILLYTVVATPLRL